MNTLLNESGRFELKNEIQVPCIGFGTWQIPEGTACIQSVEAALLCGYRHIDTASAYKNEKSVGKAIQKSKIPRNELFITSKVFNDDRGYEKTLDAFKKTIERLQTEYLDLYLIHWPATPKRNAHGWEKENLDTWRALEELYTTKKAKAIGVCNFLPHHLNPLLEHAEYQPMVNQIEYHPGFLQKETVELCKKHHILVEAWSPLGSGKILSDERLVELAVKYHTSTAQLCIRWCLQQGVLPLPKSANSDRIKQNIMVFDFSITPDDMERINQLAGMESSGLYPDEIEF